MSKIMICENGNTREFFFLMPLGTKNKNKAFKLGERITEDLLDAIEVVRTVDPTFFKGLKSLKHVEEKLKAGIDL